MRRHPCPQAHSLVKGLQYNVGANRHEYKASRDMKEHEVWEFRDGCAENAPSHWITLDMGISISPLVLLASLDFSTRRMELGITISTSKRESWRDSTFETTDSP